MCGIFGFAGAPDVAASLDLDAALAALRHRGPDDRGTFRGLDASGSVACAFAHTRLAILDLSPAGHQPMTTADGRFTIVYNGEMYSFAQLRSELEALGESFGSTGDTEVILKAFARWGEGCIERLEGMFAFGIWDRRDGSLLLCRDRLGIKPLYYVRTRGGLAFASELRALFATGVAERRVSPEGLLTYLQYGSVADPYTMAEGVMSLAPGTTLTLRDGKAIEKRYWRIPDGPVRRISFDEAVEELRPRLREAIRDRLVSDVPLGVFLSGGIDSSAVTAFAAQSLDHPLHTFTVTFEEPEFSEERYAAEVAARFGCDHRQIRLPAETAAAEFATALRSMDQPSADGINTYFVSRAARDAGLTVALSGLGGDEVFGGYANFRTFAHYRGIGHAAKLLPPSLVGRGLRASAAPTRTNRMRKLAAVAAAGGDARATYSALRSMFSWPQVERFVSPDLLETLKEAVRRVDAETTPSESYHTDPVNTYSRLELGGYLPNTLLRDTDAMSMAHALEVRVPLIDRRLVEFVASLPGDLKVRPGVNKGLLVAAAPALPGSVAHRQKMGFVLPLDGWFRGPLSGFIDEVLGSRGASASPFLNERGLRDLREAFRRGSRYISHTRVLCLLSLAFWCRENRVEVPASRTPRARASEPEATAAPVSALPARAALPRRILLCLPGAFSGIGGIEMYNRLVVKGFLEWAGETGAECEIVVANDRPGDVDRRYLPAGGSAAIRSFGKDRLRFAASVLARAVATRPDLIVFGHVNFARLGPALMSLVPSARTWFLSYGIDVWRRLPYPSRLMLRRADRILSISDFTRRELVRFNGVALEKVSLLPCALDPIWQEEFRRVSFPENRSGPHVLLTVARLAASERYKGIDSVIRALPEISKAIPDIRYSVVGDGNDRARLEDLARECGVADRVDFVGWVTPAELAKAYAGCSLFVMPSSKEGFGIVFLEAAFFGKPSLAGNHGGSPEVVRDGVTGLLVDREDIAGIARGVAELLQDPARLADMGRQARSAVEQRFTYPRFRSTLFEHLAEWAPTGHGAADAPVVQAAS